MCVSCESVVFGEVDSGCVMKFKGVVRDGCIWYLAALILLGVAKEVLKVGVWYDCCMMICGICLGAVCAMAVLYKVVKRGEGGEVKWRPGS